MEFIRGLVNLRGKRRDCAATIGNFDGVHVGHQAVLRNLKRIAYASGLPATVIIFEPQPIEFFAPDKAPSRLTRLREKLEQFHEQDVDRVLCLRFDQDLASLSATEFIHDLLVKAISIKHLVIGDDFRFAKNREGDFTMLVHAGEKYGFRVKMMASYMTESMRVSSTLIREALSVGDMMRATRMLGRPYRISGRVVHGDKRGRKLGFATANIELRRYLSPVFGIFSGRVHGIGDNPHDAVIYIGDRPVYNGKRVLLEVHILDFDADIYGKPVQVEFIEKLRSEGHIEHEQALVKQIQQDVMRARKSLQTYNK